MLLQLKPLFQHPFYDALTQEDVKDPEVSKSLNIEPSLYRWVGLFMSQTTKWQIIR